jgi:hypothetical protein
MELMPVAREAVSGSFWRLTWRSTRLGRGAEPVDLFYNLLARPGPLTIYDLRMSLRREPLRDEIDLTAGT